ncbi:MAG: DUF975 family protein [Eubacterium sp.]|nr:DUF975 family protein [Eubacterium sp.]
MNWTITEMKTIGKKAFNLNYWKAVVIALIFTMVSAGTSGSYTSGYNNINRLSGQKNTQSNSVTSTQADGQTEVGQGDGAVIDTSDPKSLENSVNNLPVKDRTVINVVMGVMFIVLFMVIVVLIMIINALLINPLEVGVNRFFIKNLEEPAQMPHIVYAFEHNYKNIAKNLFFRDLYTFLWSLLFLIPGIVKTYEYRMMAYLLAENPDMEKEEAFKLSKEMMNGNKMKAFLLDLSFIGWGILSILTLGILSIFFVNPYHRSANAALYEKLRYGNEY